MRTRSPSSSSGVLTRCQEVAEGAVYWSIQGNHRATWTKVTCSAEALCSVPEHTSLSCYWRYAELESEPGCNPVDVPTWRRTVRDI